MTTTNEIISIHIGGAGCQIGNAFWELLCLEHGIQPDGQMPSDRTWGGGSDAFNNFFSETGAGKHVPRAIFFDLEPLVVDEVRTGTYRQLFHPEQLISGKEATSGNFARGYYTLGREYIHQIMDRVRKLTDNCTNLGGFMITMATDGGTGSGIGSLVLEHLKANYPDKPRVVFAITSAPQVSNNIVAPYNESLLMHKLIKYSDASILFDNEAVYDICRKNLDIERPNYINLNRIISQVMASVTAPMRFEGPDNSSLKQWIDSLVEASRRFLVPVFTPIISAEKAYREQPRLVEITEMAFEPQNFLVKVDLRHGKYTAINFVYRGNVTQSEVDNAIERFRSKNIIPTKSQTSIYNQPVTVVPGGDIGRIQQSLMVLANTMAISQLFSRLGKKFDLMFNQRAYVHHYLKKKFEEGMEEKEFSDARESLKGLEKEYDSV